MTFFLVNQNMLYSWWREGRKHFLEDWKQCKIFVQGPEIVCLVVIFYCFLFLLLRKVILDMSLCELNKCFVTNFADARSFLSRVWSYGRPVYCQVVPSVFKVVQFNMMLKAEAWMQTPNSPLLDCGVHHRTVVHIYIL